MDANSKFPDLAEFLQRKIAEIRSRKTRTVSIRSLASKSGMSPGRFTDLLYGRRALSEFYAEKLIVGLKLERKDQVELQALISTASRKEKPRRLLTEEELSVVTGWENFAILNLLKTTDFESTAEKISERLAINPERANHCLNILANLGLIKLQNGHYERTSGFLTTSYDIPSEALKNAHEQVLLKAINVLKATEPERRHYSSLTLAVDAKKLDVAKKMIDDFRKKFTRQFELGNKSDVYNLSVQFFPYTAANEAADV